MGELVDLADRRRRRDLRLVERAEVRSALMRRRPSQSDEPEPYKPDDAA